MKTFLTLILSMFLVNVLSAIVTTTPITYEEFSQYFSLAESTIVEDSGAVWYVQYQAGYSGNGSLNEDQEIELGDSTGTITGDFVWEEDSYYSYSIEVDSVGNITADFETLAEPLIDQVLQTYDKIYVGLYVSGHHDVEYIEVDSTFNGESISSLYGQRTLPDEFVGFVIEDTDDISNITSFILEGQMHLYMGNDSSAQDWSYMIVGANVPEPSTYALILGFLPLAWLVLKRKR